MIKKIFLVVLFLLVIDLSFANNFYADIEINVDELGQTTIDGITNHPNLLNITNSQDFTFKNGKFWTFELIINDTFDDFIYQLNLPKGGDVNYIKTTPNFRLEDNDDSFSIVGVGENRKMTIVVQYQLDHVNNQTFLDNQYLLIFINLLLILFLTLLIIFVYKSSLNQKRIEKISQSKKRIEDVEKKIEKIKDSSESQKEFEYKNLTDRQKEILELIEKNKIMTQKQIVEELKLPKSSVSRNIASLANKNILKKTQKGLSVYIEKVE